VQAKTTDAHAMLLGGAKVAADFARSDEAKELARKVRDQVKGGTKAMAENPFVIGMAVLWFFPLGLYLVWRHTQWTPRTKWLWTGAWPAMFCLLMMMSLLALSGPFHN